MRFRSIAAAVAVPLLVPGAAAATALRASGHANPHAPLHTGNPAPRHNVAAGTSPCAVLIVADGNQIIRFHSGAPRTHFKAHPVGLRLPGNAADYRGWEASQPTPQVCGRPMPFIHRPPYRGDRR